MSAEVVIVLAGAGVAVAAAVLLGLSSRREQYRARVMKHLPAKTGRPGLPPTHPHSEPSAFTRGISALFGRAGLQPTASHAWLMILALVTFAVVGFEIAGPAAAALFPLVLVVVVYSWLAFAGARRKRLIIDQLPMFLEHVIRALRSGNSVEQSIMAALEESDMPIRGVFERVVRQVQLGVHLDEAVEQVALTYRLHELELLQMAITVNLRYGGGVREILENVIALIRQREQARRELKAMTGETRLSATILAVLPVALALYIVGTNPDYFMNMWSVESGRIAAFIAIGLQVSGILLIWRMVNSI